MSFYSKIEKLGILIKKPQIEVRCFGKARRFLIQEKSRPFPKNKILHRMLKEINLLYDKF